MEEKRKEDLQLEVQILQGRLKKAVDVFKEQKDDIARLTSERDEYVETLKTRNEYITALEKKVEEKSQDDGKFFEALGEIDSLRESLTAAEQNAVALDGQVSTLTQSLSEKEKELSNARDALEKLVNIIGGIKSGAESILTNTKDILSLIKSSKII